MSTTTDNPADPAPGGSDEEWARWEQTFRDARPVLPEAAMARIQDAIRREADPASAALPSRLRRRIIWLLTALIAINAGIWLVLHYYKGAGEPNKSDMPVVTVNVQDTFPLDVSIGPPLTAPPRPILPLAENWQWVLSDPPPAPASNQSASAPDILRGAERLVAASPDAWHALGLLEMRRAAHVPAPLAAPGPPNVQEFRLDALWRKLEEPTLDSFCAESRRLKLDDVRLGMRFWKQIFALLCARQDHDTQAAANAKLADLPDEFPSKAAGRARFDLLTELGMPQAQASLEVLTTRSYEPLRKLRALDDWDTAAPLRERLRAGYLAASHDLIERLFALRLQGNTRDAEDLIARAGRLAYLMNRQDLEVLLVRLGPDDAWEKLLRPLMEDEVGFIENPPQFDESRPRAQPAAIVQAAARSEQGGTVNYTGSVKLSAGSWRIACDKATVLHTGSHGVLLSGSGNVQVHGVMGLLNAKAEEMSFNTERGELKLAGRVHLEQWSGGRDVKACTIVRSGEVRDVPQ
jgi:hypothetical protein